MWSDENRRLTTAYPSLPNPLIAQVSLEASRTHRRVR